MPTYVCEAGVKSFGDIAAHHAGYTEACSNVGALLKNLRFSLALENETMGYMPDGGTDPQVAARELVEMPPPPSRSTSGSLVRPRLTAGTARLP